MVRSASHGLTLNLSGRGVIKRSDQYHWTVDGVKSGSFSASSVKQTY